MGKVIHLNASEVHLWTGQWRSRAEQLFWSILAETEQQRAERFVKAADRARYVWAKGHLRCILADYLNSQPQDVPFTFGDRGKPYLANSPIQFNLSHSGDWLVIAIVRDRAVGVDIEQIQTQKAYLSLAQRFFCPPEAEAIAALPTTEQTAAFFRLWTRKEAYLKATGEGLRGLQAIALDHQCTQQQIHQAQQKWDVINLDHIPSYAGAIALQQVEPYESNHFTHFNLPS